MPDLTGSRTRFTSDLSRRDVLKLAGGAAALAGRMGWRGIDWQPYSAFFLDVRPDNLWFE